MTAESHLPGSQDADPEKETTPLGVARDLEERAEDTGATTDGDDAPGR